MGLDIRDRDVGGERLDVEAVIDIAGLEAGVEAVEIDFEIVRGLPLQCGVDLPPFHVRRMRRVLQDVGNEISRRLERAGPRISPIGEVAVDAQRIRIRPGRTDQRADLTNPGIPAIGGERAELRRSEEHTSELQSLMRISYAGLCL